MSGRTLSGAGIRIFALKGRPRKRRDPRESPALVAERTLRNKIPETLKSGCLGAQRGDRGWSFPQVHTCAVLRWLRRYFPVVPKAINQQKTSSFGVGLVKPVAAYGAKAAKQRRDYRVALPGIGAGQNQPGLN